MSSIQQRYISNELTHFIGRKEKEFEKKYSILISILDDEWLTHYPHDPGIAGNIKINRDAKISRNEMYIPESVYFCDIPVEDFGIHIRKYGPFGISFDKGFIVEKGGLPVKYLPRQTLVRLPELRKLDEEMLNQVLFFLTNRDPQDLLETEDLSNHFDEMINMYHNFIDGLVNLFTNPDEKINFPDNVSKDELLNQLMTLNYFFQKYVFSYIKFFDHDLPDTHEKNFYFEREWRLIGNLKFGLDDVRRIIIPKEFSRRLKEDCPNYIGQLTFSDTYKNI